MMQKRQWLLTKEIKFLVDQPAFKKQKMEISLKLIESILIIPKTWMYKVISKSNTTVKHITENTKRCSI